MLLVSVGRGKAHSHTVVPIAALFDHILLRTDTATATLESPTCQHPTPVTARPPRAATPRLFEPSFQTAFRPSASATCLPAVTAIRLSNRTRASSPSSAACVIPDLFGPSSSARSAARRSVTVAKASKAYLCCTALVVSSDGSASESASTFTMAQYLDSPVRIDESRLPKTHCQDYTSPLDTKIPRSFPGIVTNPNVLVAWE